MEKPYNEMFAWMKDKGYEPDRGVLRGVLQFPRGSAGRGTVDQDHAAGEIINLGGAMDKRETIIRDYFHSWITKDDSVLRDTFAEDAHYIESWGPAYRGLADITKWFRDRCAQHDVLAWDIKGFLAPGQYLCLRVVLPVPAGGDRLNLMGCPLSISAAMAKSCI